MIKKYKTDVLLFLPTLCAGGAEKVILRLAEEFISRNCRVVMLAGIMTGDLIQLIPDNMVVIDLKCKRTMLSIPKLIFFLIKYRPKSILSTLGQANIAIILAKYLAFSNSHLVIREASLPSSVHLYYRGFKGFILYYFIKILYPYANCIVAVSKAVEIDLIRINSNLAGRIATIQNPVISQKMIAMSFIPNHHKWFQDSSIPVILGVGRLDPVKNFDKLIYAFKNVLTFLNARLIIVGEGSERLKLESIIIKLGLSDKVCLTGFVENPYNYMRNSDLFVMTSAFEGSPGALIEAIACECSVVAYNSPGGVAEALRYAKTGRLIDSLDVEPLSLAIVEELRFRTVASLDDTNVFSIKNSANNYLNILKLSEFVK